MTKKIISNEELIVHIDKYFYEVNHEHIKCLKFTCIAKYLSMVTGFVIPEQKIRRNKEIADYINKLKSKNRKIIESNAIVFVPLDVTKFINKNSNSSLLKKSLLDRDQYYKSICDSAVRIANEDILLNKKIFELTNIYKTLKTENQIKTDQLNVAHEEIKNLKIQIKKMKDILQDSVYPEIANELLREIGLIKGGENIINTTSYPVIEDTDSVIGFIKKNEGKYSDNNLIQGLFDEI